MMSPAGLAFNHGADLPIAEWSGDTNRLLKSERSVTMSVPAVEVSSVTHRYGDTVALSDVSFDIGDGTLTGLLGPNGSGKTPLFRLLATLLPVQSGQISVLGFDVARDASSVREQLGVTFQSPALDGRLTVEENLRCHGQLYGMRRRSLQDRIAACLQRLDLVDRRSVRVEQLSGGLRRRVELAKGILHRPRILLLDEPSAGLDVLARRRFWDLVESVRKSDSTTVIVSTHLMDEAERCDQLFLLNKGRVVKSGSPADLQCSIDGERLTVRCRDVDSAIQIMESVFGESPTVRGDSLSLRALNAPTRVSELMERLGSNVLAIEVAQTSLDDVFVEITGRGLVDEMPDDS
jgi:ABC-2 type transport system ATP-binding protein